MLDEDFVQAEMVRICIRASPATIVATTFSMVFDLQVDILPDVGLRRNVFLRRH